MKPPISWYWTPTSVADQTLRGNTDEYTRRMSLGIKSLCAGPAVAPHRGGPDSPPEDAVNHLEGYWTGEAEHDYPTIDDLLLGTGYRDVALDLGCGDGRYLVHLARQYQMVIGMDLPQSTLDVLQTYANVPANVYLLRADVRHLPLQSGSVTSVLAWGLLCELAVETIHHSLAEMARVLKPGGTVVLGICASLHPDINSEDISPRTGMDSSSSLQDKLPFQNIIARFQEWGVNCDVTFRSSPSFWTVRGIKVSSSRKGM